MPQSFLDNLSIEKRTKSWEKNLSNPDSKTKTFVAIIDDKVVGFGSAGPSRDDDAQKELGELWAIYVDPSHMGKGVGSALQKACLDYLRKLEFNKAILWVLTSNEKTRIWYESRGWKVEGKIKTESQDDFELHETRYIISL